MSTERKSHILLLDPDVEAATPLVKALEAAGYRVTCGTASNAEPALSRETYDAIVIAWVESGSSPAQLLSEAIRKEAPGCPLFLAMEPEQPMKAAFLQSLAIQGWISRPYVPEKALETIQDALLRQETQAKGLHLDRTAMLNLAADIFSVQDEYQLLDRIVHALVDTFKYKIAYFRLIELDGSLATYACAGTQINYVGNDRYRIPPGAGIAGQVIRSKEPISIRDLRHHPGFYFPDMQEREGMVAMLSVPIVSDNTVLGVLSCYLGEPHDFSETEIRFVSQCANLASIAINNARLIKIQNQLSLFSRELAQAVDLKSVLQIIVYHAQRLAGADGASVFPYDAEKQRFDVKAMFARGIGNSHFLGLKERPRSNGISMTVLREGSKRVENVDHEVEPSGLLKPATRDELVRQNVRAFIGIALQASRPAGALYLNYQRTGYLPPVEMLKPLETLAYQAALAIERARENEHHDHEQDLLRLAARVIASINSKDSVTTAWEKLLHAAMVVTGARVGNISVITPDGRELRQVALYGFPDGYVYQPLEIGGKSIQGQVAQLKESVLIANVKTDPIWSAFYHEGIPDTVSELTVPILEQRSAEDPDKTIIGIFNLEHPEENAFGEHDRKLLELMCEYAKIVIKIAQDWEKLTNQQKQLDALVRSAQIISKALDRDTLFITILEQAAQLANAHFATIQWKMDDRLKFEAVYPPELMEQLRSQIPNGEMPLRGNGLTVKAARTGQPVRVGNVDLRTDYVELGGKVTKAELAVPVLMNGEVWGVLNVESPELEAFDDNDEKTLVALAELLVASLKHIERHKALKVERERQARTETANEFAVLTLHMAHRLKSLLTNIPPDAAKIQQSLDVAKLSAIENIEDIHRKLQQISRVSKDVIEILTMIRHPFLSKLERKVDPAVVLDSLLERIESIDSTIVRTPEWSQSRFVIASPTLLDDVFKILLDNSQDAMPYGGIITISVDDSQTEWLSIILRDDGPGMPKDILEAVRRFLPGFSTKEESTKETRGGFGFGLYVANWFMRRLGGALTIDSSTAETDHGTTVTLTLPKDTPSQWADLMKHERWRDADGFLYGRDL